MGGRSSLLRVPGEPQGCGRGADPGAAGAGARRLAGGRMHASRAPHALVWIPPNPSPIPPLVLPQEAQGLPEEVERLALFSDAPEALPAAPQGWAALWRYQGCK